MHRDHGLERLSTSPRPMWPADGRVRSPEDELTDRYGFESNYERSKFEGETLVRENGSLPTSVFRPGMVVGSSEDGHVRTFNTLYYPLPLCTSPAS